MRLCSILSVPCLIQELCFLPSQTGSLINCALKHNASIPYQNKHASRHFHRAKGQVSGQTYADSRPASPTFASLKRLPMIQLKGDVTQTCPSTTALTTAL